MERLQAEHARRNAVTRAAWADYAPHRQRVTDLLVAGRTGGQGRICILGAGNSNDLDLPRLAQSFAEVHLVDLDTAALESGVAQQGVASLPSIHRHGGVDLTGVLRHLSSWRAGAPPAETVIDECLHLIQSHSCAAAGDPFEVVASTCLLTQIVDSLVVSLAPSHPRFVELLLALRDRHLQLLLDLVAPGGEVVLVTDIVSSDTCADLGQVAEAEFPGFVAQQIAAGNFFSGANPYALKQWLDQARHAGQPLAGVQLLQPWRWRMGPRTFAVCALRAGMR